MNNFDRFYEQKMTIGRYHLVVLCFGMIMNSAFGLLLGLISYAVRFSQFDLFQTFGDVSLITVILNSAGIFVPLSYGHALARFGRKNVLIATNFIACMIGPLFYFSDSFASESVCLFVTLGTVSVGYNSLNIYLAEVFTSKFRATAIVIATTSMSAGKIVGALLLYVDAVPYEFGAWKLPFLQMSLAMVVPLYIVLFVLKESIRYSFHKGLYAKALEDYTSIQRLNSSSGRIATSQVIYTLDTFVGLAHADDTLAFAGQSPESRKWEEAKKVGFFFMTLGGILYMQNSSNLAIANILGTEDSVLVQNIEILSGELLGAVVVFLVIDRPDCGRKRLLVVSNVIMLALCLSLLLSGTSWLALVMFLTRICNKCIFSGVAVHSNESFGIEVRDIMVARLDLLTCGLGILVGPLFYFCFKLGNWHVYLLLACYSAMSLLGSVAVPPDQRELHPFLDTSAVELETRPGNSESAAIQLKGSQK